jgi:alanine-glyoxylate transaminase / serine-glyoxylate transaminase / serine-pyruvate transaminase
MEIFECNLIHDFHEVKGFYMMGGSSQHFLQIPGPSRVPDRILRAISMPVIDHRGPEFGALGRAVLDGCRSVFQTKGHVLIYPSSGTGAWEAAIVNTLAPGSKVLMFETGHFSTLWRNMAGRWGLDVDWVEGDWRSPVDADQVEARLRADSSNAIKAVMVVHNETSTGVLSPIAAIRQAIDSAGHPALLMVDTISSLGSIDYRHDDWRVDVAVSCSQKGLMLPPGLGLVAISEKAMLTTGQARAYWDWREMAANAKDGYFPYTPATNLLYGLREAIALLREEGLENVFRRHQHLARATRAAVRAWGLEILCRHESAHSPVLTGVIMPRDTDADAFRAHVLSHYDMSLGTGLARLKGKVFRIGHLGECNRLTLLGALSGIEMGLHDLAIPHREGGVLSAMQELRLEAQP